MNVQPFKGPGSTPSRRRFWDQVAADVSGLTKQAGRNVTVSEHQGKGTFIDVADTSARRQTPVSACVHIDTVTIATPGHSYHVGTHLLAGGGTLCPPADDFGFRLTIDSVDGSGAVLTFTIIGGLIYPYPGLGYLVPPSQPMFFGDDGGFGTGFTANCTFV